MNSRIKIKTIITLSFLLLPTLAFANAGSSMLMFGMFHLFILNILIGYVESVIIDKFKIPNRTWLIIIGNFVSLFIGLAYIAPYFSKIAGNNDFWDMGTTYGEYKLQGFFVGMVISFFATLIIELPFFYLAVKNKLQRRKIFIPFILSNTLTNIIMTIVYFWFVKDGGHW